MNSTTFQSQACNSFQIEITTIILKLSLSSEGATLQCQEVCVIEYVQLLCRGAASASLRRLASAKPAAHPES